MKKTKKNTIVLIVFVAIGMSQCHSSSSSSEFQITADECDQGNPAIYGSIVVWTETIFSWDKDIYGYDLSTGEKFPIATGPSKQHFPAIYRDIVVWQDGRHFYRSIYGYKISTGKEFPIATGPEHKWFPAIYENIVVWVEKGDIYGCDLSTGRKFPIAPDRLSIKNYPAIYGDIVVWVDGLHGGNQDIWGYNLSTGEEFPICTAPGDQYYPAIYGDIVVWYCGNLDGHRNYDLYGYNRSTQTEFQITENPTNQSIPAIYGDMVVYKQEKRGWPWIGDIWGYNLSTGEEFPICTAPGDQSGPAIYGNTVVWMDERNGNWDIYGTKLEGFDTDRDGIPDTLDNCPLIYNPEQTDTDNDGTGDACDNDIDNDGLSNSQETTGWDIIIYTCTGEPTATVHVTSDPYKIDTDNDGLTDFEEKEGWNIQYRLKNDNPPPVYTWVEYSVLSDPQSTDSDSDGIPDNQEKHYKTDPNRANTDCDGAWDTHDTFETDNGLNPVDCDTDNDGLTDGEEIDLWIYACGYSPEDVGVIPSDVLYTAISNTKNPDSDNDGLTDGEEVNYWVTLGLTPQEAMVFVGEHDMNNNGMLDSIENFSLIIERLGIHKGVTQSLTSKVDNAVKSLGKENTNAAINQLYAFINEVTAQKGKKIPDYAAYLLINYAQSVISQIQA